MPEFFDDLDNGLEELPRPKPSANVLRMAQKDFLRYQDRSGSSDYEVPSGRIMRNMKSTFVKESFRVVKGAHLRVCVVLNNIRSMHNVGSIFRTADAAGCEKIYLCGITPGPLDRWGNANAKLLKVSLGAEKFVAWEQIKSTTALLDRLKKQGFEILALEKTKKATSLFSKKLKRNQSYALILGNEKIGLSRAVLKRSDTILEIPMRGKKESLNVSVAFGIAIFQLTKNA